MKIINLIEDSQGSNNCRYEHGLSFYIETEKHKLLFDTGASDAFIENASKKGIDLSKVDTVIISHGHYDHTGGLVDFSILNPNAEIYINKNAFDDFYNLKYSQPKYIGMDKSISSLKQLNIVEGNARIDDELAIFTNIAEKKLLPKGNCSLKKKCGDIFIKDEFEHEQYLVVTEGKNRILFSGCAHNGIINSLNTYRALYGNEPTLVVSGFHTVKNEYTEEDDLIIAQTAHELKKSSAVFYSGHCTGDYAMGIMKEILGKQLHQLHSGDDIVM